MFRYEIELSHKANKEGVSLGAYGRVTVTIQNDKDGVPGLYFDGVRLSDRLQERFIWEAVSKIGATSVQSAAHNEAAKIKFREKLDAWKDGTVTIRNRGEGGEELDAVEVRVAVLWQERVLAAFGEAKFKELTGWTKPRKDKAELAKVVWPMIEEWEGEEDKDGNPTGKARFIMSARGKVFEDMETEKAMAAKLKEDFGFSL